MKALESIRAHIRELERLHAQFVNDRPWSRDHTSDLAIATVMLEALEAHPDALDTPFVALKLIDRARLDSQLRVQLATRSNGKTRGFEKAWRRTLHSIGELLWSAVEPTNEDADAVLVARDLHEMKRTDEAIALLTEQAPRHLGRRCAACGSVPGRPCQEPDDAGRMRDMVVPHDTRVIP